MMTKMNKNMMKKMMVKMMVKMKMRNGKGELPEDIPSNASAGSSHIKWKRTESQQ